MVLFEGEYSGVLEPERHFIALKKDFSNFEDVVSKLRDHFFLQAMADRTYEEVALDRQWSYQSFIEKVDTVLTDEVARRTTQQVSRPYSEIEFERAVSHSVNYYFRRKIALFIQSFLLGIPYLRKLLFCLWGTLPHPIKRLVRPLARIISR